MRVLIALLALLLAAAPALAFDATPTFKKGSTVLSLEGGGGHQDNLEGHRVQSGLDLWYVGVRYSLLPFEPAGPSILRGAFEIGLEPVVQIYENPPGKRGDSYYAGLGVQLRWHLLSFGRFVPYFEGGASAGGTNLRVREIDSDLAFLLTLGAGASLFITENTAIYAGYRLVHVSNGNTDRPNRGFEAHTGLLGISYYFK
jgi:opacity protein-like surface antigen